nr:MAG TPA: hypothetical protein [Caudoviricetes sp.]
MVQLLVVHLQCSSSGATTDASKLKQNLKQI